MTQYCFESVNLIQNRNEFSAESTGQPVAQLLFRIGIKRLLP